MFCPRCGNPIPEGQQTCAYCDPPVQQSAPEQPAPMQQPAFESAPMQQPTFESAPEQQPAFELSTPDEGGKKKKKKKGGKIGGKIALISTAVVLVAAIVLTVINWGAIVLFFKRTFAKPADYLQSVHKAKVASVAEDLATSYDEAMGTYSEKGYCSEVTMKLELGDAMMTLLNTALSESGVNVDISWVKNIVLEPKVEMYEDTMRMDVGVGVNDTTLGTVSAVYDMADQMIYLGIPEANKTFVELDVAETLGYEFIDTMDEMMASREMTAAVMEALPSGDELEELINKYAGVVIEQLDEAEKETVTLEAGDLKQKVMAVTVELTPADLLDMGAAVLETAQDDDTLIDIIEGIAGDGMGDAFADGIDEALDSLDMLKDEAPEDAGIIIETYIDNKSEVVGRTITVSSDDEEMEITYMEVKKGNKFAFYAGADVVEINGEGTIKGDARTGEYTLSVDGTDYVTLELEDFICADNKVTGTLRLIPEGGVVDAMGDAPSSIAGILTSGELELVFGESSVSYSVKAAGSKLFTLSLSGSASKPSEIAIPDSASVSSEADLEGWVADLEFDAILKNMEKAGVPDEYVDLVENATDMIGGYLGMYS